MLPYFILMLTPMWIQHVRIGRNTVDYEKRNKMAMLFFFVWLTVLLMLRGEVVGNDTRSYHGMFYDISGLSWKKVLYYTKSGIELGFLYFVKIVSLFTKNSQVFLGVTSIMVSAMIYPTYKRLCKDASLTIVLFGIMSTFVMMFSGIRQMISIGLGFVAYELTRRKKLGWFIVVVLLAISFHTSAFMLLMMYPLYYARITKKWLYAVVPVLTLLFVYNKQIFTSVTRFLAQYTKYDTSITETGAVTMLILFVAFAVFSFLVPDEALLDSETVGLRNMLLLSIAIQMFAPLHMLAMRMNYYYIIFIPLLLPKIIACRNKQWEQVAVVGRHAMVLFFFLYFFFSAYTKTNNLNVFPYHFFWETVA